MRSTKDGPVTDEYEPLLPPRIQDEQLAESKITPLPKLQLSILLLLQVTEPMASHVIYPFINQLVGELDITGGDPRKVGYYAGLIESLFFATQAMCTFNWSRASDRVGRKPVLLSGLAGLSLSMTCFGLSKTFWSLVVSRSLAGLLNGNMGVIKSMMGELTDSTNMAQAFAFIPIVWSVGGTVASLAGGTLSRPYDRFPNIFGNEFWKNYPYLLPCFFSTTFIACSFLIALFFMKETIHKSRNDDTPSQNPMGTTVDGPLPLRSLMTRPILLSVANYFILSFSDSCLFALMPLFYSTPIELGGLGFDAPTIGICLGTYGIMNGLLQVLFFSKIVRRFGPKRVIVAGALIFAVVNALFPVINRLALVHGISTGVYALLLFQLLLTVAFCTSFGAVFIFVTSSAPTKRSLGSVNGISQTTVSIARAIGPTTSTSLFAFSLQSNWLGGNAVYLILMSISVPVLFLALQLPRRPWK